MGEKKRGRELNDNTQHIKGGNWPRIVVGRRRQPLDLPTTKSLSFEKRDCLTGEQEVFYSSTRVFTRAQPSH